MNRSSSDEVRFHRPFRAAVLVAVLLGTGSQWGSGAIASADVQDRVVNVRECGATGDGRTNDAPALTTCVAQLSATRGRLYFPPGTYRLATTVTFTADDWTVEGTGWRSVIKPDAGVVAFQFGHASAHPSGWEVSGLKFDCSNGAAVALELHGATDGLIRGNWFSQCGKGATKGAVHILQDGGFIGNVTFLRNRWSQIAAHSAGVRIPAGNTVQLQMSFIGNAFNQNGMGVGSINTATGISIDDNGRAIYISGNDFEDLKYAVKGDGVGTWSIIGNGTERSKPPANDGEISLTRNATIIGNTFNGGHGGTPQAPYAISLGGYSHATITGNFSFHHKSGFARFDNFTDAYVASNNTVETLVTRSAPTSRIHVLGAATEINSTTSTKLAESQGAYVDLLGADFSQIRGKSTRGVGTSATTVYIGAVLAGANSANLVIVSGCRSTSTNIQFVDLVLYMTDGSATVIASQERTGPAPRTYSVSGGNLQLTMAAGTYHVTAVAIVNRGNG